MKRILAAILTAVLCLSGNLWAYSGGAGTPESPYQIATVADFQKLSTTPTDWSFSFILTANISLTDLPFAQAPIAPDTGTTTGFQGTAFTGAFDGNGYTVSHLTIATSTKDYIGLFGRVGAGGRIHNLAIENVAITGDDYVGGLAGWNDSGAMTFCHMTGSVGGDSYVGGLTGNNSGSGSLANCYAAGSVNGINGVGGLVGWNSYGSLTDCYATGSVGGTNGIGGLTGWNSHGPITACYAVGSVSGTNGVGGLAGQNDFDTIIGCFWDTQTCLPVTAGVGEGVSAGVTGKTTAEMKTLSTFTDADWDFANTWWMPAENYPRLISFHGTFTLTLQTEPSFITSVTPSVGPHAVYGVVNLSATSFSQCPDEYQFDRWEGGAEDPDSASTSVLMTSNKTLTAVFTLVTPACGDKCHPCPTMDFNRDCRVGLADFAMFTAHWMECTAPDCD